MESQKQNPNQPDQVPPQQIVAKMSRLAALLNDIQRLAEEYSDAYLQTISLKIKGTNMYEILEFQCENGYKIKFNTNDVYMFIEIPGKGGYRVIQGGEGAVGDIITVPLECWDKLNKELEDLIRRKLDEIAYMKNFYYIYTSTF